MRHRLLILVTFAAACSAAPTAEERQNKQRRDRRAICVPEPDGPAMRGTLGRIHGDPWDPECGDLLVAPCEFGVDCIVDGLCSCTCEEPSDCKGIALAVGQRHYLGHMAGWTSTCDLEREVCVWALK